MDGYRTDHMGLSPDGRRLVVSDSTERQVLEYSMVNETVNGKKIAMGDRLRRFESGETPTRTTTPRTVRGSSTRASARSTRRVTRPVRAR